MTFFEDDGPTHRDSPMTVSRYMTHGNGSKRLQSIHGNQCSSAGKSPVAQSHDRKTGRNDQACERVSSELQLAVRSNISSEAQSSAQTLSEQTRPSCPQFKPARFLLLIQCQPAGFATGVQSRCLVTVHCSSLQLFTARQCSRTVIQARSISPRVHSLLLI